MGDLRGLTPRQTPGRSTRLGDVLWGLLELDPDRRLSAASLLKALSQLQAGPPLRPRTPLTNSNSNALPSGL